MNSFQPSQALLLHRAGLPTKTSARHFPGLELARQLDSTIRLMVEEDAVGVARVVEVWRRTWPVRVVEAGEADAELRSGERKTLICVPMRLYAKYVVSLRAPLERVFCYPKYSTRCKMCLGHRMHVLLEIAFGALLLPAPIILCHD